jgi:hypothetical protein
MFAAQPRGPFMARFEKSFLPFEPFDAPAVHNCTGALQFPVLAPRRQASFQLGGVAHYGLS